ncbi:hypothetical protein Nepgr_023942 [Nepenthes gracilis]|uniref:Uncharacterized protein n=1 Tax=Nepenthes gracilis TaxID=150966 RepID=A0AAD3T3Y6_NEPGR|nr:hypothetical protein Nepgr_023942 [Nepenthes gracilis]
MPGCCCGCPETDLLGAMDDVPVLLFLLAGSSDVGLMLTPGCTGRQLMSVSSLFHILLRSGLHGFDKLETAGFLLLEEYPCSLSNWTDSPGSSVVSSSVKPSISADSASPLRSSVVLWGFTDDDPLTRFGIQMPRPRLMRLAPFRFLLLSEPLLRLWCWICRFLRLFSAAVGVLQQPAFGMQGIGCCFLLFVGCADAHWLVVSLNGFAVQSTLGVLHRRVLMPTGMIWLMLILMWVATDAGVHVALDVSCGLVLV